MHECGKDAYSKTARGTGRRRLHDSNVLVTAGANQRSRKTGDTTRPLLGDSCISGQDIRASGDRQTKEIKASEIDPCALPYVVMSELSYLPACSGIYFTIEESGRVVYIGQSVNIRRRWRAHHVQDALSNLSDLSSARRVRIAWLEVNNIQELNLLELTLIRRFKPCLNKRYTQTATTTLQPYKPDNRRQNRKSSILLPFPPELEEAVKLSNEAIALTHALINSGHSGEKFLRICDRVFSRNNRRSIRFHELLAITVSG